MSQLILEIERMREIMGLGTESKPIILEQVGALYKIFQSADNALKNVEDNKVLIKQLDSLKPKGVAKLTTSEIDELAQLLSNEADSIARAMASTGFESATRLSSARKLNKLILQTARKESDSLLNLYITKQLTKIYDDSSGYWNKSYVRAANQVKNELSEFAEAGIITTEDDLINSFKIKLKNEIQKADDSFKWSDYPDFESWAMKKFNDTGGTLDNISKDFEAYVKKSANRDATFKSTSVATETKLSDIDQLKLTNFRFLQGIRLKLKNFFKKTPSLDTFEKNVALLKGFPIDNIFKKVGDKQIMSPEFAALVRNIGFDIEQIANLEKNTLEQWRLLMDEAEKVSPELVTGMKEVPIFKEVGNGWIWQEEKLSQFIERLEKRFEGQVKDGGGFWGLVKEELKEIIGIVTLGKNSIIASTKNLYGGVQGFLKGVANQKFFSSGIWGAPFSPKQVGLMLSRRGYAPIPFLRSFLETWFTLHIWHNVVYSVVGVIQAIGIWGLEKIGVDVTDDNRTVGERITDTMYSLWVDYTSYLNFPFKPGFFIDFTQWVLKVFPNQNLDQTERELNDDRDKTFRELWDKIDEPNQEKILRGLETGNTGFDRFSKITDKKSIGRYFQFKKVNNLTDEQITKLREARVATISKENRLGIPTEKIKDIIKDFDVDKYLNVGGIRDKNNIVYTINSIGDDLYRYEFTPPDIYTFYGVQPDKTNKIWFIYKDESDKEPEFLTASDLKSLGFNTGYNEQGGFDSKETAEKVKEQLIETVAAEPQPPISIQELLKRL